MSSLGVVLSAGVGNRFHDSLPKQYHKINGKRVVGYVIDEMKKSNLDEIIVMCGNDEFCQLISKEFNVKTLIGGLDRNETVYNAIEYARKNYTKTDNILFFDSARPNITKNYINDCIEKLESYDCVITTQKITDSLGNLNNEVLNRENYYLIQTPECFKLFALDNFDKNFNGTAIVQQIDRKSKIYKNFDCKNNIKITYPTDIKMASIILEDKE